MAQLFAEARPEAVIHYAEQPSAPYSMMGYDAARRTLRNNLEATFNAIWACLEHAPQCHIVKLGTMGEYGTPNIDIEEGWIEIEHKGRKDKFLFPRAAGSLYHTTKVLDTDLLWFYVRIYGIARDRSDAGPGLRPGHARSGSRRAPAAQLPLRRHLRHRLNRFLVQAVAGVPLTVYGGGGQTRGYLNLNDTLQLRRARDRQARRHRGELRILNQFTETFSVNELAERVAGAGRALGLNVPIKPIANPRKEREQHYYHPAHSGLVELGLEPHLMTEEVLVAMLEQVRRYADRIDHARILPRVRWNPEAPAACAVG